MKLCRLAILICCIPFLSGCTLIPTAHGTAQFWGDYDHPEFSDDGRVVTFKATSMNHSNIVRAHWRGAGKVGSEAVTILVPGGPVVKGTLGGSALINNVMPQ